MSKETSPTAVRGEEGPDDKPGFLNMDEFENEFSSPAVQEITPPSPSGDVARRVGDWLDRRAENKLEKKTEREAIKTKMRGIGRSALVVVLAGGILTGRAVVAGSEKTVNAAKQAKNFAGETLDNTGKQIQNGAENALNYTVGKIDAFDDYLYDKGDALNNKINDKFDAFEDFLSDKKDTVESFVGEKQDQLRSWVEKRAEKAEKRRDARRTKWTARKQAAINLKNGAVDSVSSAASATAEGVSKAYRSVEGAALKGAEAVRDAHETARMRVDVARAVGTAAVEAAMEAARETANAHNEQNSIDT